MVLFIQTIRNVNSVTECGKLKILGGYDKMAGGTNQKEFFNIPLHNMIRIVANFHFIDKWQGENAFLKLNIGRERSVFLT